MKLLRLLAIAAVVSLAACTSSPTESARTDAGSPRFDGGGGLGSGNYSDDGLLDEGATPAQTDTTARGPGMLGSGN